MNQSPVSLRRQLYGLIVVIAVAMVAGRILNLQQRRLRRVELYPTHSSNDRSRWATVRALVDHNTYKVGARTTADPMEDRGSDEGIITENGWKTVDKVLKPEPDPNNPNVYYFYSSKPPLYPTIVAGEYWVLKNVFGMSITEDLTWVVRISLLTFNVLPFLIYLLLLVRWVERFGRTDWGKLFVIFAGGFATFVPAFANTLNNHTVAACTAMFALHAFLCVWPRSAESRTGGILGYGMAGLFAGLTAALELPALALVAVLFVLLWRLDLRRSLLYYLPPVLVVFAAFFVTNYLAIGRLIPAYAEADAHNAWYKYKGSHWREEPGQEKTGIDYAWKTETGIQGRLIYAFNFLIGHHGVFVLTPIFLMSLMGLGFIPFRRSPPEDTAPGPKDTEPPAEPINAPPESEEQTEHTPDQAPESEQKAKEDPSEEQAPASEQRSDENAAEDLAPKQEAGPDEPARPEEPEMGSPESEPSAETAFENFSQFTPKRQAPAEAKVVSESASVGFDRHLRVVAGLTAFLTVVIIGFYLYQSKNYGGFASGPRWLFWLTPFWLLTMVPVADWFARHRWSRGLALVLLAISVLSASYPTWNPWQHPWIYQLLESANLFKY